MEEIICMAYWSVFGINIVICGPFSWITDGYMHMFILVGMFLYFSPMD